MTFLTQLRGVFAPKEQDTYPALNDVFTYLLACINPHDAAIQKEAVVNALALQGPEKNVQLLHAYLNLEHWIITHAPPSVTNSFSTQTLRDKCKIIIKNRPLPKPLQIIFVSEKDQMIEVCSMAVQLLIDYSLQHAGVARVQKVLKQATYGTPFQKVVGGATVDSAAMRQVQSQTSTAIIQSQYKHLYQALFEDISTQVGKEKVIAQCQSDYEFFKNTYDKTITTTFLSIVPDGVLELEHLAFMSREELERKIAERTEQLRDFSTTLEKKVEERTQELKKNVDELAAVNKHLMELDQAKTEFISVAAHQLRTPLTALKWILSALLSEEEKNFTSEQRELLTSGFESNERMIALINEMLVVMKIESGKMIYTYTSFQIEAVIENVIASFVALGHARKITFEFTKPTPPLPMVKADVEKIRGAVQNLLENAINYSEDGDTIVITAEHKEKNVIVSVKDSGIGIPEKQQGSIFDKFFRADNASTLRPAGSGLGLFIVKNIITMHGGTIGFTSVENQGTVFYFSLPIEAIK